MQKRKTVTSNEVKDRWNEKHYDQMQVRVPAGARAEVQAIAAANGMSVAAYIRHLIIKDNAKHPETTRLLRGGVAECWENSLSTAQRDVLKMANAILDGVNPDQLPLR